MGTYISNTALAPSLNPEQIIQYVDTGCLILFIVAIAGFLLAFLRGLLRGWKQGTYRFLLLAIFAVTMFCLIPVFTPVIGGVDLRQWLPSTLQVQFNGKTVDVAVGTSFETVYNFVVAFLRDGLGLKASPDAIANYAIALTISILRLVLVFLIAFLTLTVWALLVWILWHAAFKHIIKREKRVPKLRVVSGLQEALAWAALTAMMVIPISGLVNAIRNNAVVPEGYENETVQLVGKIADTYDKSIFNQAFFAWTKGNGTDTLDTQIAQFFAEASYSPDGTNSFTANVIRELRVFGGLEGSLSKWLYASKPEGGTATAIIHESLVIEQAVYNLGRSTGDSLFNTIVPMTLDIASNAEAIDGKLGSEGFAFNASATGTKKKAWAKRAFNRVAETPYVSAVEDPTVSDYAIPVYGDTPSYSEASLRELEGELRTNNRRALVNSIVAGYVHQAHENPGISESPFSLEAAAANLSEEQIDSIDWVGEAIKLQNLRSRMRDIYGTTAASSSDPMNRLMQDFRTAAARDPRGLVNILVGERDEKGEPVVDPSGLSVKGVCLLDSDLVAAVLPIALEYGSTFVADGVFEKDPTKGAEFRNGFAEVVDGLGSKELKQLRVNYRRELGKIFDVAANVAETELGAQWILDYENTPGVTFDKNGGLIDLRPELASAFKKGIVVLDESKLLTFSAPRIAQYFMDDMVKEGGSLAKLGITKIAMPTDGTLGAELGSLLDIGVYCNDLISALGGLFAQKSDGTALSASSLVRGILDTETETNHYQLTHLLDLILSSKILNPEDPTTHLRNGNIVGLLNSLFKNFGEKMKIEFTVEELAQFTLPSVWEGNVLKVANENHKLVQAMRAAVDCNVLDALSGIESGASDTKVFQALSSISFDRFFAAIGQSGIMRLKAPDFLDPLVLAKLAEDYGDIGMTYANLTTPELWEAEGVSMQALVDLAAHGIDLSNFDPLQPVTVDLLGVLAGSKIFVMPDGEYVFQRFVSDKLIVAMDTEENLRLICDFPNSIPEGDTRTVKEILKDLPSWTGAERTAMKKKICSVFVDAAATLDTVEKWVGYTDKDNVYHEGEIDQLRKIMGALAGMGGIDGLNTIDKTKVDAIAYVLRAVSQSRLLGPTMSGGALYRALSSKSIPDMLRIDESDPANVPPNVGWLYRNGKEQIAAIEAGDDATALARVNSRIGEFEQLVTLLDVAYNSGVIGSGNVVNVNFATLDVDFFLRPFLRASHDSKILHPTGPNDVYFPDAYDSNETTKFQDIVSEFLYKSGAFVDDTGAAVDSVYRPLKHTYKSLIDVIKGVKEADDGWYTEIDAICHVVDCMQSSSFIKDGKLDLSPLSNLNDYFARPTAAPELSNFLNATMESECFYRCIPAKLEDAVSKGFGIDPAVIPVDYDMKCADFFYTDYPVDVGGVIRTDYGKYAETEIPLLISALEQLSFCTKVDPADISTVDGSRLSNALIYLAQTHIFNTNTEKAATVFAATRPERAGLTAFQCLLCDVINIDSVRIYYYDAESPKDIAQVAAGTYGASAVAKFAVEVRDFCPAWNEAKSASLISHYTTVLGEEWGGIIKLLQQPAYAPFAEGKANPLEKMNQTTIAGLLHALNDCRFFRDCVPNAFHKAIAEDSAIQIDGIYLKSADPFFSYYYHDGNGHFDPNRKDTPDWNMPFYDGEIDQIAMLYTLLQENKSKLADLTPKTVDPIMLRSVLLDLSDSYTFHLSRVYPRAEKLVVVGTDTIHAELTVFEQMMNKFCIDSKLADTNYRALDDLEYSLTQSGTSYVVNPDGAKDKARGLITKLSDTTDNWLVEIEALTTNGLSYDDEHMTDTVGIIAAAKKSGIFDSTDTVSIDFEVIKKVDPIKIEMLLQAINRSEYLLSDVLTYSIEDLVNSVGIKAYSVNEYTGYLAAGQDTLTASDFRQGNGVFHGVSKLTIPLSTDPTGHFKVLIESGVDVAALVPVEYKAARATFDIGGLHEAFTLILEYPNATNVEYTYEVDLGDFHLDHDELRTKAIPAFGKLLSSVYRGSTNPAIDSQYYVFNNVHLNAMFNDPESNYVHSTYGLLNMFAHAGFYEETIDAAGNLVKSDSSDAYTTVKGMALFNAIHFQAEADVHIVINVPTSMGSIPIEIPNNLNVSIGSYVGPEATTDIGHVKAISDLLDDCDELSEIVREAAWFDQYAASAVTMELYGYYSQYVFLHDKIMSVTMTDFIRDFLVRGIDQQFSTATLTPQPIDSIISALNSLEYSYDVKVPIDINPAHTTSYTVSPSNPVKGQFNTQILAGIATRLFDSRVSHLSLDAVGMTTPVTLGIGTPSTRYSRIGDPAKTVIEERATLVDDLYGVANSAQGSAYFAKIGNLLKAMRASYVKGSGYLNEMADNLELVDGVVGSKFANIFYISAIYDNLFSDVFKSASPRTDFAMVNGDCYMPDPDDPLNTKAVPFSFATLASVLRA